MNQNTKDIASYLKVSIEQAMAVQKKINEDWLIDWSEDSDRKIKRVSKEVATELGLI